MTLKARLTALEAEAGTIDPEDGAPITDRLDDAEATLEAITEGIAGDGGLTERVDALEAQGADHEARIAALEGA